MRGILRDWPLSDWLAYRRVSFQRSKGLTVAHVELALRIASQTLNHVQLKLEQASAKGMPDGR